MSAQAERRAAYDVLIAVERGAYAHLALKQALRNQSGVNAGFITALVYTALDHQITLDFYLDTLAKQRIALPVRCVLRLGAAQILYMNVPARAAVDESVKLCRDIGKKGVTGFVNAMLRNLDRMCGDLPRPDGDLARRLSIQYSYRETLVRNLLRQYGEALCEKILAHEPPKTTCARANTFRCNTETLDKVLTERGVVFSKGRLVSEARHCEGLGDITRDELFMEGKMVVQGESAMLVGHICQAKSGMRVLDACAAPGGKALHLAQIMGCGTIEAWDIHEHRVALIEKNVRRCGIDMIKAGQADARVFDVSYEQAFDVVLVDAPCSGLGVAAGKPDIRYAKTPEALETLVQVQREILCNCARYVARGGVLVYATCTILRAENEDNIEWFLQEHPHFCRGDIGFAFDQDFDRARLSGGQVQLLPPTDGVEGFFVARMVRE